MVHPLQSGFLPGRCILENFALAAELVQQANKRKKPNCTEAGFPKSLR